MSKKAKIITAVLALVSILIVVCVMIITTSNNEKSDTQEDIAQANNMTALERLFPEKEWKNQFSIEDADGESYMATISADITVPKVDSMSVVEVEYIEPKSELQKELIKKIFDNNDIYYNDSERRSKEQWQRFMGDDIEDCIQLYKMYINTIDSEESKEFFQGEVQRLEEEKQVYENTLKKAPNEYQKVDAFDSESYLGYIDGEKYTFSSNTATKYDDTTGTITEIVAVQKYDMEEVYPDEMKEHHQVFYDQVRYAIERDRKQLEGCENKCSMSEEEAKQFAERYVRQIGDDNYNFVDCDELYWTGINNEGDGDYVIDGYVIDYTLAINGISLSTFGTEEDYWTYLVNEDNVTDSTNSMRTNICFKITSNGIVDIVITNPVTIVSVTNDVKLLELSSIYSIMIDEITSNSRYYGMVEEPSDSMDLIYFRVRDKENNGHYTFIPTWRLCKKSITADAYTEYEKYENEVLVNAIDGSVIKLLDEF